MHSKVFWIWPNRWTCWWKFLNAIIFSKFLRYNAALISILRYWICSGRTGFTVIGRRRVSSRAFRLLGFSISRIFSGKKTTNSILRHETHMGQTIRRVSVREKKQQIAVQKREWASSLVQCERAMSHTIYFDRINGEKNWNIGHQQ